MLQTYTRTSRPSIPLTDENLMRIAPSIFAEEKHSSRSDRYAFYSTKEVLLALRNEGFYPYSAVQSRNRIPGKEEFTKHMITFRHASQRYAVLSVGDEIQELHFTNSHDGTSKAIFQNGIYRLVCSNGMKVGKSVDTVEIPHRSLSTSNVIEGAYTILKQQEQVAAIMDDMKAVTLDRAEQHLLAATSSSLRWDSTDWRPSVEGILSIRRKEDTAPTLWNTFNRIQENLVKGGIYKVVNPPKDIPYAKSKVRAVTGITELTKLNTALFDLADSMRRIKLGLPAFDEVCLADLI